MKDLKYAEKRDNGWTVKTVDSDGCGGIGICPFKISVINFLCGKKTDNF